MDETDHLRSAHEAYTEGLCRICGMRARTSKEKSRNKPTRKCVNHEKTILNLFHIDISRDEDIHSPTLCYACYSKIRYFERSPVTVNSHQSALQRATTNSHIWCKFDECIPSSQCPLCAHYLYHSFGNGGRKRKSTGYIGVESIKNEAISSEETVLLQTDDSLISGDDHDVSQTLSSNTAEVPNMDILPPPCNPVVSNVDILPLPDTPVVPNMDILPPPCNPVVPKLDILPLPDTPVVPKLDILPLPDTPVVPKLDILPLPESEPIPKRCRRHLLLETNPGPLISGVTDRATSPRRISTVDRATSPIKELWPAKDIIYINPDINAPLSEDEEKLFGSLIKRKLFHSKNKNILEIKIGEQTLYFRRIFKHRKWSRSGKAVFSFKKGRSNKCLNIRSILSAGRRMATDRATAILRMAKKWKNKRVSQERENGDFQR